MIRPESCAVLLVLLVATPVCSEHIFTDAEIYVLVRNAPSVKMFGQPERCLRVQKGRWGDPKYILVSVYNICARGQGGHKIAMYFAEVKTGLLYIGSPEPENLEESSNLKAIRRRLMSGDLKDRRLLP